VAQPAAEVDSAIKVANAGTRVDALVQSGFIIQGDIGRHPIVVVNEQFAIAAHTSVWASLALCLSNIGELASRAKFASGVGAAVDLKQVEFY
jgi:6,7-dimethyl-8-ribityllumazine synthase